MYGVNNRQQENKWCNKISSKWDALVCNGATSQSIGQKHQQITKKYWEMHISHF